MRTDTHQPEAGNSEGTSARVGTPGLGEPLEVQLGGDPDTVGTHTFVSFASRSSTRFPQWLPEKNPLALLAEGEDTQPGFKNGRKP